MEKVFELDKKSVNKEVLPVFSNLGMVALYALVIYLCGFKFDFFFMVLFMNSQSHNQRMFFADFETISVNEEKIALSNGKSLVWSEIDWSISYVLDSFISLRSLNCSWKDSLLISPQFFTNYEDLVTEVTKRKNDRQLNLARRVYFQQDSFKNMLKPLYIFGWVLFVMIIVTLVLTNSQGSILKVSIDSLFVLLAMLNTSKSNNYNKEFLGKRHPIAVSDEDIFLDDSHAIKWSDIDWEKSSIGFLRTKLVQKEAWKNKVSFWSQSYTKELREEIFLKRSHSKASNKAVLL